MAMLPTGTVTFLFTDIEGSTKLAQAHPAEWETARRRHDAILHEAIGAHHGVVFQIAGDAFCAAFMTASDGLKAALETQRVLQGEDWGALPVRVRMGLHTGPAEWRNGEYEGYLTLARAQRIMSAGHGGQVLLSLVTAELVRGDLQAGATLRDLGEHRLKSLNQSERLFQVSASGLPSEFPALASLSARPNNLPIQLTSFVGRERELSDLMQLLQVTRLLTLTGSGGTGKTRLSLQLGAGVTDDFKDGVWLVELAPLTDPTLVPASVVSVLGVREEPGRARMATLLDWLRTKQLLLILDNCEHLIEACAKFADAMLHACPDMHILATSREALGIAGEVAWRVPSLPAPSPDEAVNIAQLEQYAAVRLFIERARVAYAAFNVTNANALAIAQICHRLDGIPLAIELAAARVRGLSVEQIAARLENSFQLLTGGSRTALPRQQTLHALIDWSYDLLSEPERQLLQRLSVFAAGWNLEAAETVGAGEGIELHEILDLLLRLQDKSLIAMVERERHSRYRLLETVRQYAREKLLASGQSELVRNRHLNWFTQLAEETEPKLRGGASATAPWMAKLEEDFDNIRAAITWASERQSEAALRLVGALFHFWGNNGQHIDEGRALSEHVLTSLGALPYLDGEASSGPLPKGTASSARARAEAKTLMTAGSLAFLQGDYLVAQSRLRAADARAREVDDQTIQGDLFLEQGLVKLYLGYHMEARALYEQSVLLARHAGDLWRLAYSLRFLGEAVEIDDPEGARKVYEESLTLFRQAGDHGWARGALINLAHLASEGGDYAQERALLEESLAIRRKGADKYMTSITLNSLAEVMCHQHDYEGAAPLCEEALGLSRAAGNKSAIAWSLRNLAGVARGGGDVQRAEELLRESLSLYQELSQKRDAAQVIEALTTIALAQGRPEQAAVLLGAANALRKSIHVPRSPSLRRAHDQNVAAARAVLGDAAFEAPFAEGLKLTFEQAMAVALGDRT